MCPAYSLTLNHISHRVEGAHISFRFHSQVPVLKTALRTKLSRTIGFVESSHLTIQTAYFGWDETSIHLFISISYHTEPGDGTFLTHVQRNDCNWHKPKQLRQSFVIIANPFVLANWCNRYNFGNLLYHNNIIVKRTHLNARMIHHNDAGQHHDNS